MKIEIIGRKPKYKKKHREISKKVGDALDKVIDLVKFRTIFVLLV